MIKSIVAVYSKFSYPNQPGRVRLGLTTLVEKR